MICKLLNTLSAAKMLYHSTLYESTIDTDTKINTVTRFLNNSNVARHQMVEN